MIIHYEILRLELNIGIYFISKLSIKLTAQVCIDTRPFLHFSHKLSLWNKLD